MSVFPLIKAPQIAVFAVSILLAVINIPFVVLRFVARRRSWGKFTLSDAALLAAFVSVVSKLSQTLSNLPGERGANSPPASRYAQRLFAACLLLVRCAAVTLETLKRQKLYMYPKHWYRDFDRGRGLARL